MNAYTQKTKDMNITAFAIKGVRWFQKSYGNTYHTTYISALIDGTWQDIGSTAIEYGYGEHYLCTAGKWLIENGYLTNEPHGNLKDGYQLNSYEFRSGNAIEHYNKDVQRKRDL